MSRDDLAKKAKEASTDSITQFRMEHLAELGGGDPLAQLREAAREIETTAWRTAEIPLPGDRSDYHLPHGYDRTRVILLVRDPYWLHSYWEVGSAEREEIRRRTGRELDEFPNILRVHDLTARSSGDPALFQDIGVGSEARSWYLETGKPGHSFQVELGADFPGHGFVPLAQSNVVTAPVDRVSDVLDEEWMVVEEDFRRLYRMAAGLGPGRSSIELMDSLTRRLARQMGSGAVSSLGSGFRPPGQERRFWLVAETELIVYGATQPDASVLVDGQPIRLRPDGTFTARFALPDGERAVPVRGSAADGMESITITPVVRKETHWKGD